MDHQNLPMGSIELLSEIDNFDNDTYTFVKNKGHLSILVSYRTGPKNQYYCDQFDFPLKALAWFPWVLEEFRKPPAEGGLHAGAMISKDMDVEGEMLAVGSETDGYYIINRSRNHRRDGETPERYRPTEISFSWEFLYKKGLLDKWIYLGKQYEAGYI